MNIEVFDLGKGRETLGTRELGARDAQELRDRSIERETTTVVDFVGVQIASSRYLDEIACALRGLILDYSQHCIVLRSLTDDVHDTLMLVLGRRGMSLTLLDEDALHVLGDRGHLDETLRQAQELGTFTASQLADRLELKVPNLHQRLNQLRAAGAVFKLEPDDRRSFRFATPPARELASAAR